MEKELNKAFKNSMYHPKDTLNDAIWQHIVMREKRAIVLQRISYGFISLFSFIGFIITLRDFGMKFTTSGFGAYLSASFSAPSMFFSIWKDLALSLIESVPTMSLIVLLALLFVFLGSLKYVNRSFKPSLSVFA